MGDLPVFSALPLEGRQGLRLVGELDMASVTDLRAALAKLAGGPVTLDLGELTFIDSTGLHALVVYAKSLDGDTPLVLENVPQGVRQVFEITGLDRHPGFELRSPVNG